MTGDSDKKTVWKFLVENIVYFLFEHHTEILNFFKIICFLRYRYFSSVYIGDLFLYLRYRYFSSVYTGDLFLYLCYRYFSSVYTGDLFLYLRYRYHISVWCSNKKYTMFSTRNFHTVSLSLSSVMKLINNGVFCKILSPSCIFKPP
jgi:hypothetical protein